MFNTITENPCYSTTMGRLPKSVKNNIGGVQKKTFIVMSYLSNIDCIYTRNIDIY